MYSVSLIDKYIFCPLSKELFKDPDGYTYEKERITEFRLEYGDISPITREKMKFTHVPNIVVKIMDDEGRARLQTDTDKAKEELCPVFVRNL